MRVLSIAYLVVLLSGSASAQTTVAPPARSDDVNVVSMDERAPRLVDKKFVALGAMLGTSMALDTKSTFDVFSRCERCFESNPYAAPFVNRGPAVAFSTGTAFDVGVMVVAAKMRRSSKPQLRKIWWLVPTALATGHLLAYRHNLGVAR